MTRSPRDASPQEPSTSNPLVVMANGHVKWFDNKKGFGFISNENGADVFVHYSAIQGGGFKTLKEGESVQFELIESDKGYKAQNVLRAEAG